MKKFYRQYAGNVEIAGISMDPLENLEELQMYMNSQGYNWHVVKAEPAFFKSYNILVRSTKIAVNSNGEIIWRKGYGITSSQEWQEVFQRLTV